jgi:hypothetical protein
MKKIVLVLSGAPDRENWDNTSDVWVMDGLLDPVIIQEYRRSGRRITVFDKIDAGQESKLFNVILMAMLHNDDWRTITVLRADVGGEERKSP